MSHRHPIARCAGALAVAVILGTGIAACSSDSEPKDAATTKAPEDLKVPMTEVIEKLPAMVESGTAAAAAAETGNFDGALGEYDELHEVWEAVEGTIKDTDLDAYEAIETAQGLIKDGAENDNAERVTQGVTDQAEAVTAFIAANES